MNKNVDVSKIFNTNYKMEIEKDYRLNRAITSYIEPPSIKSDFLEDRDLFFKFSNNNQQIDMSKFPDISIENNLGMPVFNTQIHNNKKGLLSNPFITDNDNTKFKASNYTIDSSYEEIQNDINNNTNNFDNMAYNNNLESNIIICKLEKQITEYEYLLNMNKNLKFLVDVDSPFGLGYIWKTLILLSKNPSLEFILKLMNDLKKEELLSDMKNNSDLFKLNGTIQIIISEESNKVLNSNFINKIEDVYNILIRSSSKIQDNKARINLNYNFDIEFPEKYEPTIIFDNMLNYHHNKFKFIQLINVPVTSKIFDNILLLEIQLCNNNVLGFIYDNNRENLKELPYDLIMEDKKINSIVNKLIIPKINKNSKKLYSEKYKNELQNIHLGEITYGKLFNIDIITNINLDVKITNEEVNITNNNFLTNYQNNIIEIININHKCYYYVKNTDAGKLLINGIINFN